MQKPLLHKETNSAHFSFICVIFTCIVLLSFIFHSFSNVKSAEVGVGAPPSWDPLLETYFDLEALTAREHATPYRFKEDPDVGASPCDMHEDTENCDLVCEKILSGERHKTSKYCYKPNPPGFDHCWDTTKMKCWNTEGNCKHWDGAREWKVIRHMNLLRGDPMNRKMRMLHMRNTAEKEDVILFGWGSAKPVRAICNALRGRTDFMRHLWTIPRENTLLIGGHSEGSGWAVCLNEIMQENGFPNLHNVIASGTLVPMKDFLDNMDEYSKMHSLFMLNAQVVEGGQLIPDIFTMICAIEGYTLPHFGYICNADNTECLGIMTQTQAQELVDDVQERRSKRPEKHVPAMTKTAHMLTNYKKCWRICRLRFGSFYDGPGVFNYQANIPSFEIEEYPLPDPNPHSPITPAQLSPELVRPSPPRSPFPPFMQGMMRSPGQAMQRPPPPMQYTGMQPRPGEGISTLPDLPPYVPYPSMMIMGPPNTDGSGSVQAVIEGVPYADAPAALPAPVPLPPRHAGPAPVYQSQSADAPGLPPPTVPLPPRPQSPASPSSGIPLVPVEPRPPGFSRPPIDSQRQRPRLRGRGRGGMRPSPLSPQPLSPPPDPQPLSPQPQPLSPQLDPQPLSPQPGPSQYSPPLHPPPQRGYDPDTGMPFPPGVLRATPQLLRARGIDTDSPRPAPESLQPGRSPPNVPPPAPLQLRAMQRPSTPSGQRPAPASSATEPVRPAAPPPVPGEFRVLQRPRPPSGQRSRPPPATGSRPISNVPRVTPRRPPPPPSSSSLEGNLAPAMSEMSIDPDAFPDLLAANRGTPASRASSSHAGPSSANAPSIAEDQPPISEQIQTTGESQAPAAGSTAEHLPSLVSQPSAEQPGPSSASGPSESAPVEAPELSSQGSFSSSGSPNPVVKALSMEERRRRKELRMKGGVPKDFLPEEHRRI